MQPVNHTDFEQEILSTCTCRKEFSFIKNPKHQQQQKTKVSPDSKQNCFKKKKKRYYVCRTYVNDPFPVPEGIDCMICTHPCTIHCSGMLESCAEKIPKEGDMNQDTERQLLSDPASCRHHHSLLPVSIGRHRTGAPHEQLQ